MPQYAKDTQVPSDRSRAEIERTLMRYGATSFAYAIEAGRAAVMFMAHNRKVRMIVPLPDRSADELTKTPTGRDRSATQAEAAFEQAVRQRWRALLLLIKAQLEAVEAGITSFEDAWLPWTVLPSGRIVADEVGVQVAAAYALGKVTPLEIEAAR